MKVQLNRVNDAYLFEAKGANTVSVFIDNKGEDVVRGASPMELILMGVGGCSAIDIIHILKKQRQEITSYSIDVTGTRKELLEASPFDSIHLNIYLEGAISEVKAKRAAALSFEKYCSVSMTLMSSVKITYDVSVNGEVII